MRICAQPYANLLWPCSVDIPERLALLGGGREGGMEEWIWGRGKVGDPERSGGRTNCGQKVMYERRIKKSFPFLTTKRIGV